MLHTCVARSTTGDPIHLMFTSAQRLARLGSWIWDARRDRFTWSEQTYDILCLSIKDFDGTMEGFLRLVHPEDGAALRGTLERVLAGVAQFSYRYRLCGRDGRERLIMGDGEAQYDPEGAPLGLVGTVMDATQRERERQAIRDSEASLRRLVALSSDWYWEQDAEFRFTRFVGGGDMREEQRSDLLGKRRWELPAAPLGWTWEEHRATLRAREPFRDLVYRLEDGRYIRVSGEPVHDADGAFLGYRGTASDITEHKRAEERLRQSHAMLRMAMRVGRIGAWSMQWPQGSVTWTEGGRAIHTLAGGVAPSFEQILERTAPASRAGLQAAVEACVAQSRRFEVEIQLLEGALPGAWMRLVGECDEGAEGACVLHGTMEDITERKLAAERVRELGSRLVATLDTATECFITVNRDWCFTYINHEAERLLKRARDELLGRNMWEEFPEAVGSRFDREYRRALAQQQTVEFDEFYPALGQWLRIKASPSPQGLAIYFRDITDSLSVREALLDSQQHLHRLFEHTTDGMLHIAHDGRILDANPAACRMLARTRQELLGMGKADLMAPHERRLGDILRQRASVGRARGELCLARADGVAFESEVSSIEYAGADGSARAFLVFRDISERVRAQHEVLALNARLEQRVAQRTAELEAANAELKAFAHSLAHDLRAPIAAIDGFSDLLERALPAPPPERARHYLDRIRGATGKMDAYTTGLLTLARVSQAQLNIGTVDLSALARDILVQLQEGDRSRRVEWHVDEGLQAQGDPALLRMAFDNLLGNAWKFTGRRELAQIRVSAEPAGGGVAYCVQDNGAGFDAAYADKLFGSFQRLHTQAEFPGTGIGLANVQRIVARHGGRIWAESQQGAGASFFFTLNPT